MDTHFQHIQQPHSEYYGNDYIPWLRLARNTGQPYPRDPYAIRGLTVCSLCHRGRSAVGLAFCSGRDQFNRKKGRELAQSRALKALKGK